MKGLAIIGLIVVIGGWSTLPVFIYNFYDESSYGLASFAFIGYAIGVIVMIFSEGKSFGLW